MPTYQATHLVRQRGAIGKPEPRAFSVPCAEETTEAIFRAWQSYYGRKWEPLGVVSIFTGRDRRQVWPKEVAP